ncbi:MAG: hypothetical protein K2G03_03440, partial [Bacilli bacterium]|nr:hypothetical protein [Bacilli bacterium]
GHELLHIASSFYNELRDEVQCGFSQATADGDAEIGRGFNEGYTDYLAFKIFGERKDNAYKDLVLIARLLELFFDNPRDMEDLYFSHDLPGFIHYMERFIPYDKMIGIVLSLDKIYMYDDSYVSSLVFEVVNVEMELYRYFVNCNPSPEKLEAFESIIKEKSVAAKALKREKRRLVREKLQDKCEPLEEFDYFEDDLAYKGTAK